MKKASTEILYFETGRHNPVTLRGAPGEEFEVQTQLNRGPWLDGHPDGDAIRATLNDHQIAEKSMFSSGWSIPWFSPAGLPTGNPSRSLSGEVNWYRFEARKGQRLVISTLARQLIPYIADAVPGWFQPVLAIYDAQGTELAYNDDFRFKPDPTILFEVPQDGEYALTITDAIYHGREDFVYRVTIGELPFVTSIFPVGRPGGGAGHHSGGKGVRPAALAQP